MKKITTKILIKYLKSNQCMNASKHKILSKNILFITKITKRIH